MINSEAFTKRLNRIINYYGESASSFAEKIGVQRSSISHILSGRNKPSLEFILKIISSFPEVELYWLINGKGEFPKSNNPITKKEETTPPIAQTKLELELNTKTETNISNKSIERIVIFYSDGSFKNYHN